MAFKIISNSPRLISKPDASQQLAGMIQVQARLLQSLVECNQDTGAVGRVQVHMGTVMCTYLETRECLWVPGPG